jgi:hypothetical protein
MNDDSPADVRLMIDRQPLARSDNSPAQASECRCRQPRGVARAAGGLCRAANRCRIAVQEPATGASRLSIVMVAQEHTPSIPHPAFLQAEGIVLRDWEPVGVPSRDARVL